uniref:Uncharacterized protein n=1 Tax=Arundo donax TaxID=35708 RepID=A0A0A9GCY4_ARUDO
MRLQLQEMLGCKLPDFYVLVYLTSTEKGSPNHCISSNWHFLDKSLCTVKLPSSSKNIHNTSIMIRSCMNSILLIHGFEVSKAFLYQTNMAAGS